MTLVDTSVWIDHLRTGVPGLSAALEAGRVLCHPFVVGELACGTLQRRAEVLGLLQALPQAPVATDAEVRALIERRGLMGRGLGLVDVHLLAAALLAGPVPVWTRDRRLAAAAAALGVGYAGSLSS